jgi:hypothetical protein
MQLVCQGRRETGVPGEPDASRAFLFVLRLPRWVASIRQTWTFPPTGGFLIHDLAGSHPSNPGDVGSRRDPAR